jgi:photosystem II stability/assembly factor-like uncharacterized protein
MDAMAAASHVYAGVVRGMEGTRGGLYRQAVGETGWDLLENGLPEGASVHAVTPHPTEPDLLYIGTTKGGFRSFNRGGKWERLALPNADADVWSITIHPTEPRTIYAGVSPPGVFRSDDGGDSWKQLADPNLPPRVIMSFACRVMRLAIDPNSPDDVYAALEAAGTMRSRDRGETWEDCATDLLRFCEEPRYRSRIVSQTELEGMLDGHALTTTASAPGTVFLANRMGLFKSADRGESWADMEVGRFSPLTYGRDLRTSPHDPNVMFAALSPAFSSFDGGIFRSGDVGRTWQRFDHGVKAETTMMAVALHPRDASQVYGVSKTGQVFGTQDGGKSWAEHRLPAGAGDCYALACG